MDFLDIGDTIDYPTYNALVYLLRKFKRLTSDLKISSSVKSDYGTFELTGGLTSVGGNYILEDDVTITSNDALLNCFYIFYFTVVDVNLSGTVNRRVVSVTGDTGDNGELSVVLDSSLLESDEQILPDFKLEVDFDPHEYYTPANNMNIELTTDKTYVDYGETATITATVTDSMGEPITGLTLGFDVNGTVTSKVLDENGQASIQYTGTDTGGKITIKVSSESIVIYDGGCMVLQYTGNSITTYNTIYTNGEVTVDWGDGTTSTINNQRLKHTYSDGVSNHRIVLVGEVTRFEMGCFYGCSGLTSVTIPDSVTILGASCFSHCSSLASVTIPSSVTSLGAYCFYRCRSLVDYQLYWEDTDIISYVATKMPNNTGSLWIVPVGEVSNYETAGYPTGQVVERGDTITLTADKPIIQSSETSTITAKLIHDGRVASGETLSYEIKHGSTTIDSGTDTTDSNGEITITYTGTAIGQVDITVSYGSLLIETYELIDATVYDDFETSYTNALTHNGANVQYELTSEWYTHGSKSVKCTLGTSSTYVGYGDNSPSKFIGSTIHYKINYKAMNSGKFRAVYQQNGSWIYAKTTNISVGEGIIDDSVDIPSDATSFRLRFMDFTNGGVIYLDEWVVY